MFLCESFEVFFLVDTKWELKKKKKDKITIKCVRVDNVLLKISFI